MFRAANVKKSSLMCLIVCCYLDTCADRRAIGSPKVFIVGSRPIWNAAQFSHGCSEPAAERETKEDTQLVKEEKMVKLCSVLFCCPLCISVFCFVQMCY